MVTRSNNGDKLEAECKFGLLKYFGYAFKFPDTRVLRINKQIKEEKIGHEIHQVWAGQMPSDFYAVKYGIPYLLECKSVQINIFSFTNFKEHQLISLKNHKEAGGKSVIIIQFRLDTIETFVLDIDDYLNFVKIMIRKSFTLEFCQENFKRLGREQVIINDKKVWILSLSDI